MSAETEFRAALVAHAPLVARVHNKIAQNAAEAGWKSPYIVFTSERQLEYTLSGDPVTGMASIEVSCWAVSAASADAVADEVVAAVEEADAVISARMTGFDPDLGLNATILTVEWWDD